MKNGNTRKWLLLGGKLSGYTFDLFETVAALGDVEVRFLYSPLDGLPSFQHEHTGGISSYRLWWHTAGWAKIREFVREPAPDVVFVYGNCPRIKMAFALSQLARDAPVYYVADTNIAALAASGWKILLRRLACRLVARRASAALSLGQSNRLALQLLGFRQTIDLPSLAVDFDVLDRAAAKAAAVDPPEGQQKLTLLIIARLVPEKNLPAFAVALASDADLANRVRVVIAGEGPDRFALETIRGRSPNLDLELMGAIPHSQIGAMLARADALLLPSRYDPWGIVVVEALGMGVPVIATSAVGAAVSLAGETQAILVSESAHPSSFLDAIRIFGERRASLSRLARAASPGIRARYGRTEVANKHLELVYGHLSKNPDENAGTP